MAHYILRYRGAGAIPEGDVEHIRAQRDVQILDTSPRMLLIDAPRDDMQTLAASLADWVVTPETTYTVPDPRPHVVAGGSGRPGIRGK
jgi:hypothetical protein